MNNSLLLLTAITVLLLPPTSSYGQLRALDTHFSVIGAFGGSWSGDKTWTFQTCDCAPIYPGVSYGVGIEYGPIVRLEGTQLMASIEMSYGQEQAEQTFSSGRIDGRIQRIPIMLWTKIISDGSLSPFLRFGAGLAKTDFKEDATARGGPTIRFHEWHFSWGVGGGMNYQLNRNFAVELFVDQWESEKQILGFNSDGGRRWHLWTIRILSFRRPRHIVLMTTSQL